MLEVLRIQASSFDLDATNLLWELSNTQEDHLLYTVEVQRSESVSGPWDTLVTNLKDVFFFSDTTLPNRRDYRTLFYRLKIVEDIDPTNISYSPLARIEPEEDLLATEMSMRRSLVYREFAGRRVVLYPKRTFGTHCPRCWDDTLKKRKLSRCTDCYSTSFAGGFMRPIETFMQINRISPDEETATKYQEVTQNTATIKTWNFPPLKPGDLIIEKENIRWLVKRLEIGEKNRATVWQMAIANEVDKSNVLYKLPVPIDPMEFQASPAREMERSSNVEEAADLDMEFSDMLQAFGIGGPR